MVAVRCVTEASFGERMKVREGGRRGMQVEMQGMSAKQGQVRLIGEQF